MAKGYCDIVCLAVLSSSIANAVIALASGALKQLARHPLADADQTTGEMDSMRRP
jgi:hypothetical protein